MIGIIYNKIEEMSDEALFQELRRLSEKLNEDDRCQPVSGAQIALLEEKRDIIFKELERRGAVLRFFYENEW